MNSQVFKQGSTTNLIFDTDDDNAVEDNNFSYAKASTNKQRDNLGEIMRENEGGSSSDLLDETHMQSSEFFIYGSGDVTQ